MKISLFLTSMNRAEYVKQTLLKNIEDNSGCEDLEFLVLNYNSSDDLEAWIRDNCTEHIKTGKLIYYREKNARYFAHAADNIAARLCSGEIICNIMADVFTGKGFASYVNNTLTGKRYSFIRYTGLTGAAGVICMRKKHFLELGGYDETLKGWGGNDTSLVYRAIAYGLELIPMEERFCSHIKHPDELRTINFEFQEKNVFANIRTVLEKIAKGDIIANKELGFGKATVYRNFNENEPVILHRETWTPDWRFSAGRSFRVLLDKTRF